MLKSLSLGEGQIDGSDNVGGNGGEEGDGDEVAVDEFGLPSALNMDEYDEEEDNKISDGPISDDFVASLFQSHNIFQGGELEDEENDDQSNNGENHKNEENEDDMISDQDEVILVGYSNQEAEYSSLEVQVLDSTNSSLYVHHDLMLPSCPLCIGFFDDRKDATFQFLFISSQ